MNTSTDTTIHQINETHLGTDATPEEAQDMAKILTKMGYHSEYNSMQGVSTSLPDGCEIPDAVWNEALAAIQLATE